MPPGPLTPGDLRGLGFDVLWIRPAVRLSSPTLTKSFLCYRCVFKLRGHPPHLGKNPCSQSLTHPDLNYLTLIWGDFASNISVT